MAAVTNSHELRLPGMLQISVVANQPGQHLRRPFAGGINQHVLLAHGKDRFILISIRTNDKLRRYQYRFPVIMDQVHDEIHPPDIGVECGVDVFGKANPTSWSVKLYLMISA